VRDLARAALVAEAVPLDVGDRLALAVTPDGDYSIWIMRPLCSEHEAAPIHGDAGPVSAPHEQVGDLPTIMRMRIARVPFRCTRARHDGQPCRTPVPRAGVACFRHRTKSAHAQAREGSR
jgi:hypothetical protein